MTKSKIEWTERVWNPTTGCNKVSQGCKNCYAEVMHKRLMKMYPEKYAKPFLDGAIAYEEALFIPDKWKKPAMVFVNSMSDLFHEYISFEFINAVFSVMADIDRHTYQVLTKRPERMVEFFEWKKKQNGGIPWQPSNNVWLGVSVEDQATADVRFPLLLQVNARVKFLSCEPLLGPIQFKPIAHNTSLGIIKATAIEFGIDWLIIGGESGYNARPLNPEWVKNIIEQCRSGRYIPIYFKQWGEWLPASQVYPSTIAFKEEKYKSLHSDGNQYFKVGKNLSGRMIDGTVYNQFPSHLNF